jgi:hypothetical protein
MILGIEISGNQRNFKQPMNQGRLCPIGISITHIVGYLGISLSFARTYIVGANFLACGRGV